MKLLFNGHPWPKNVKPQDLNWASCWHDDGPSPAGNTGFYLHVPHTSDGTTHRIYFTEVGREALADAIRRPMGVIPTSAEGLLTPDDLDAAEKRRVETEPKEVK